MRAIHTSLQLKRIALLMLLSVSTTSAVSAQTSESPASSVEAAVVPGTTVWMTDSSGREEKRRIVSVSDGIVTAGAGDNIQRLRTTDVVRVRVRHSDSVINGALIGAGAAVASGLFLCTRTEPWENCRDDVGPIFRIGAIGAGIGIGIDALIRGQRTIYDASQASTHLHAVPIIASRGAGLRVSLRF